MQIWRRAAQNHTAAPTRKRKKPAERGVLPCLAGLCAVSARGFLLREEPADA